MGGRWIRRPNSIEKWPVRNGLWEAKQARPPYQGNDYPGWILWTKLQEAWQNRTRQTVEELRQVD